MEVYSSFERKKDLNNKILREKSDISRELQIIEAKMLTFLLGMYNEFLPVFLAVVQWYFYLCILFERMTATGATFAALAAFMLSVGSGALEYASDWLMLTYDVLAVFIVNILVLPGIVIQVILRLRPSSLRLKFLVCF